MRKLEDKPWWPQLVEKKDEYSLRELAEMFGATPGAINTALKRNGITRKPAPPGPRKSRKKQAAAKADVVKRGPRKSTVAKLEPYKDQLGKVADMEIASLAGVSNQTVAAYRKSLGIAATTRRGPKPKAAPPKAAKAPKKAASAAPKKRGRKSKIAPYDELLGKVADAEIAKKAGVSQNAVRNRRFRMGIAAPPRPEKKAPPKAAKAPAPKKAPKKAAAPKASKPSKKAPKKSSKGKKSKARLAFRVYQKGADAVVVASSLVEAAEIASSKGKSVKGLELLGPVLG